LQGENRHERDRLGENYLAMARVSPTAVGKPPLLEVAHATSAGSALSQAPFDMFGVIFLAHGETW
jgi:hypothetical protein